jgi:ParB-like chromosome segregation protein Spo0J
MTKKFEVGKTYEVDPVIVIAREDLRGRKQPVKPEKVQEIARSMASPHGQLQPVKCRLNGDGLLELVFGFTRREALLWGIEQKIENIPTTLRIEMCDWDDLTAISANVSENHDRNDTNVIDDAHNAARLKAAGLTGEKVAEIFHCKSSWITELSKLLRLSEEHQQLIIDGKMTGSDGIMLAKLGVNLRKMIIDAATDTETGNVPHDKIMKAAQSVGPGDGGGDGDEGGGEGGSTGGPKKQLTVKQIKEFFQEQHQAEDVPQCWSEFSYELLRFINNDIQARTFQKKVDVLLDNLSATAKKAVTQAEPAAE